jgi:2-oxoacid:acceptor oxidoreductase gamma subunit (pyruvate/2-ketoisovalerate family)
MGRAVNWLSAVIEIRFHGRGGQGVVVGSEILADAAMREGKYTQAFPTFGPERRGAPLMSFTRIDDKPIRLRCQVYEPNYVIVLDASISQYQDLTSGLRPEGAVIINTPLTVEEIKDAKIIRKGKIYPIDASSIAMKMIGTPILNTIILGAFSAATGEVKLQSLFDAVRNRFLEALAEKNIAAMKEAYGSVKIERD